MSRFTHVLFDLDGTLVDSGEGITKSVQYALSRFGIEAQTSELFGFIGPPLVDSFMRFYGFSKEKAGEATDFYRERYRVKGVYENKVYPGIPELLKELQAHGVVTAVATSKPEIFANTVTDDMGLKPCLNAVFGAELDDAEGRLRRLRIEKADVIAYALERLGSPEKSSVLMVGDRRHDIEGAKANGVASCGVLFGFGSLEELEAAGADFIVSTPEEISHLVLAGE